MYFVFTYLRDQPLAQLILPVATFSPSCSQDSTLPEACASCFADLSSFVQPQVEVPELSLGSTAPLSLALARLTV